MLRFIGVLTIIGCIYAAIFKTHSKVKEDSLDKAKHDNSHVDGVKDDEAEEAIKDCKVNQE